MRPVLPILMLICTVSLTICQESQQAQNAECREEIVAFNKCLNDGKDDMHKKHIERKNAVQTCFQENGCTPHEKMFKRKMFGPQKQQVSDYKTIISSCFDEMKEKRVACVLEQFPDFVHREKQFLHHKDHETKNFHMCQLYNPSVCPDTVRQSIAACLEAKQQDVRSEEECDKKRGRIDIIEHHGVGRHHGSWRHHRDQHHHIDEASEEDALIVKADEPLTWRETRCNMKSECLNNMSDKCQARYKNMKAALCECSKTIQPDVQQLNCLQDEGIDQTIKDKVARKLGNKLNTTPRCCVDKCDQNYLTMKEETKALRKKGKGMKKQRREKKNKKEKAV